MNEAHASVSTPRRYPAASPQCSHDYLILHSTTSGVRARNHVQLSWLDEVGHTSRFDIFTITRAFRPDRWDERLTLGWLAQRLAAVVGRDTLILSPGGQRIAARIDTHTSGEPA